MEIKDLVTSFEDSISEEVTGCATELAEVGLDAIMDDGLLKEIPFVSTAISIYKIGQSLKERHYIKKLTVFLDEINKGSADEDQRKKYRLKCASDQEFRNKELEYVLVLIDRYISLDKPRMLGKLYLAYFDEIIVWEEFTMYAEVIDRFLQGDYFYLREMVKNVGFSNSSNERCLRLMAAGLVNEVSRIPFEVSDDGEGTVTLGMPQDDKRNYQWTEFGKKLVKILA